MNTDSTGKQAQTCAERWTELLGWLDFWFQPEKAGEHDFGADELELFGSLAPAWLAAAAGEEKIAVLDGAADQFGRECVLALIEMICAKETGAYWSELVRAEGGSIDTLVRLLWEPLPGLGFQLSSEQRPDCLQYCVTRCPHATLAAEIGGSAADWLFALVCAGDPHVAAAFDPPIRFERTKTLMQGGDCCDHAYFVD